ncbi:MAG: hypothetical protein MHMPM18_004800 [Marteilia pararefringens]
MPESVRVDGQLVKLEWNFDESEQQRVIGAQSQFSMMFPKYREKYLRDIMEDIVSYLKSRVIYNSLFLFSHISPFSTL